MSMEATLHQPLTGALEGAQCRLIGSDGGRNLQVAEALTKNNFDVETVPPVALHEKFDISAVGLSCSSQGQLRLAGQEPTTAPKPEQPQPAQDHGFSI